MAYTLSELKKQIPGVSGEIIPVTVPPLSPRLQRWLDLQIAVNEGLTTEHGTPSSHRAEQELARIAYLRLEKEQIQQSIGHTVVDPS